MNAPREHRETVDVYRGEIVRQGRHRGIHCRDGIQCNVPRYSKGAGARWRAVGCCTTGAALNRLWPGSNAGIPPKTTALPKGTRGRPMDKRYHRPSPRDLQLKRVHPKFGVSEPQTRLIAGHHYAGGSNG